jgi:hypothetical protein
MKNFFLIIQLLSLCGCLQKTPAIIDLDAPKFYGTFYSADDKIIFQFDEPLKELTLITPKEEKYFFENRFPIANIYMESQIFESYQNSNDINGKLQLTAVDTSNNSSTVTTTIPYLNRNPGNLSFSQMRLQYTKKLPQKLQLHCVESGSTHGYTLNIFHRSAYYSVEIPSVELSKNENLNFIFKLTQDEEPVVQKLPNKNYYAISWNKRLPKTAGLIYLSSHTGETLDSFAYYDGDKHTLEEYKATAYHKKLFTQINSRDEKMFDIQGNTAGKCIFIGKNKDNLRTVTIRNTK